MMIKVARLAFVCALVSGAQIPVSNSLVKTENDASMEPPAVGWTGVDIPNSNGHFQGISVVNRESPPAASSGIAIGTSAVSPSLIYICDASINAVSGLCTTLNSTIAGLYTSKFTDVNASIYITFGSTGLGQSQTIINNETYTAFRTALQADETDANDVTAVNSSVPSTNPINAAYTVYLTNANARALGFAANTGIQTDGSTLCTIGTASCYDGIITVSSAEQSTGHLYFRTGPAITGSQYDFYSVVEHETDEVLGTASCAISGCRAHNYPSDLYRYQSNGKRSFAAGNNNSCASSNSGNACFSLDGIHMLQQYNNLNNGADAGDWVTNCALPLVQDAFGCPGVGGIDISPAAEILVLDVIGYNLAPTQIAVPDVIGLTQAAAITAINAVGLMVGTVTTTTSPSVSAGSVISESPTAGTQANFDSAVNLVISGSQPISVGPSAGSAGRQVFTFVARDGGGAANIQYAQFLFGKPGLSALNACYISYDPVLNAFYLLSDDETQWYGLLGGSAETIGNAQCTIYGATSSSTKVGTDLTTTIDISFRSGFAGLKTIYQFSGDILGNTSGWQQMGTWNDTGDPNLVELISLTPNFGTGTAQMFTNVTADGHGASAIQFVELVMNTTLNPSNACFILFEQGSPGVFYLLNNDATNPVWSGLIAGSATSVSNSQCTLNGVGSGAVASGSNLTVRYNLTFSESFVGTKQIYMQAADAYSVIEFWHQIATWNP